MGNDARQSISDSKVDTATKRIDVIRAAQELLAEVGYAKTGVREIARRAHVAVGTIYANFGTGKVGVLQAALDERVARLVAHVDAATGDDPVDLFLDRARRLNRELVGDPFLRRIVAERDRVTEPILRDQGHAIAQMFATAAVADLNRLVEDGAVHCSDPEAVATLVRAATTGWALWDRAGQTQTDHDRMLETLLSAIRALLRTS
ncbi:hypothetical protein BOO86_21895 [Mycobacterium sp. CBMA 234]|uniref:TetR/AcrR family transcriptional regulator n=1 Tax=Mycolicibacterium sp. CBMA 234 TaxID=1918495 RepID=UPI0012DE4F6A|nr:TetR/AcrR family transcriptional regulator [Mycolicibacterium sp. CBMA 234]MUL67142.1 hypothetical protein [Mycolicibacterium sp. CBMA 234]